MKSRITIEVDFDNGQPYIKVQEDQISDDVRDKLIKFFRQRLGHTSSWCTVEFVNWHGADNLINWLIRPITPDTLEKEYEVMGRQVAENKKYEPQASISH